MHLVCMSVFICTCAFMYMYIYECMYMYACMHVCLHVFIYLDTITYGGPLVCLSPSKNFFLFFLCVHT